MREDIERIIKQLERAQELLYKRKYSEANTAIYEAQCAAIFVRDNKDSST